MTHPLSPEEHARTYKDIREDYRFDSSIFTRENDRVAAVKWIIDNKLTEAERIIILLYTDCHSYRKLAQRMGMSHYPIAKEVHRIREKILKEYEKMRRK